MQGQQMTMEIKSAIEKIGTQFEEFKKHNDQRLAEIEKRGHADPLLEEKVDRVANALNEAEQLKSQLEQAIKRISAPSADGKAQAERSEYSKAFYDFIRKGISIPSGIATKAMSVGTPSAGGYFVPEELDRRIIELVNSVSPIESLVGYVSVGTSDYKRVVNVHGATTNWVGETTTRAETSTPNIKEIEPYMGELQAMPYTTQQILEDSFIDIENWLFGELTKEYAKARALAFISGDGVKKPRGFLNYPTAATADGTRDYGTVEHVGTGVSGGFAASTPADILFDVQGKLKAEHKLGAVWAMAGTTLTAIRKFKKSDYEYLLVPGLQQGQATSLLGHPVVQIDAMPTIAASSLSIAFGNFKSFYEVVDRVGMSIQRNPFALAGYVRFEARQRVGGFVTDSEAVKLVKFV
jgi:HK97 family phage major capsid protein